MQQWLCRIFGDWTRTEHKGRNVDVWFSSDGCVGALLQ
jgi:hypothetical protein